METMASEPAVFSLQTGNPPYEFPQSAADSAADFLARNCNYPRTDSSFRKLSALLDSSAIDRRFFSFPDASPGCTPEGRILVPDNPELPNMVTITEKNKLFVKQSIPLAVETCGKTLKEWGGPKEAITHIVSVTCTGMLAPGIEFYVIDQLGLPTTCQRVGVNMMGCYGTTRGLTVAKALAAENPRNRVLMFCCELCSIQFPGFHGKWEEFLGVILFADGCAASVIGVPDKERFPMERPLFRVCTSATQIIENTPSDMAWWAEIEGFRMRLTRVVPKAVSGVLNTFLRKEILKIPYDDESIKTDGVFQKLHYAFHPGGRAIIDLIAKEMNLSEDFLTPSRETLRKYGNMSSATLMFVFKEILDTRPEWFKDGKDVIAMAFGPGLGVDAVMLKGCS